MPRKNFLLSGLKSTEVKLKIHEAVIYLLDREGRGMTSDELSATIKAERLPLDNPNVFPSATDINRRVSGATYKDKVFVKKDGLIFHLTETDKRLMRLTFNTTGWVEPIGHKWSPKKQGSKNAFENQYGFGFEEWLFNDAFLVDGYQYGAIRGCEDIRNLYKSVREVHLFTVNQRTRERFLAGIIYNVQLIAAYAPEVLIADALFKRNRPMLERQLSAISADKTGLDLLSSFSVRFRPEDIELFPQLVPAPELAINKAFNRFMPYIVDGELEQFLAKMKPRDKFNFTAGRAARGGSGQRTVAGGTSDVDDLHVRIIDQLEFFLNSKDNPYPGQSGIEKIKFGWNTADVVIEHKDRSYSIFEVKTSANIRRNIRDGIGQLLDYACWYPDIKIQRLVVVSPESMSKREAEYFKRVQASLDFVTHYWRFNQESNKFEY
jgi:hypothetical protein